MKIILIGDDPKKTRNLRSSLEGQGIPVTEADCDPVPEVLINDPDQRLIVAGIQDSGGPALAACRSIRGKASEGGVYVVVVAADAVPVGETGSASGPPVDGILREPPAEEDLAVAVGTGLRALALAEKLKEAEGRIRSLSVTDSLTGCYSRKYLEEHLPHEIKRAVRYGRSISVIACDIDRLDAINGVWGGGMGDQVLVKTAHLLRSSTRRHIDWVARNEEDGFAIVLPETGPGGAFSLAERLRKRIGDMGWEEEQADLRVTAGFGYAGFPAGWEGAVDVTAEMLIDRAKGFLRDSQRTGLNRISGGSLEARGEREAG